MKRLAITGLVILGLIVLLLSLCVAIAAREESLIEEPSPSGRFVAWAALRNHVTGYDTIVRVRDLKNPDGDSGGGTNYLVAFEDKMLPKQDLQLIWEDETTLVVEYYAYAKIYGISDEDWHGLSFVLRTVK